MKKELGLIHIYCGDGKGKTTAAMGLALRAIGSGFKVVIVQFLKNGCSSEINILKNFSNTRIFVNAELKGFTFSMNDVQKDMCKKIQEEYFMQAAALCNSDCCDVLILDEVIGAVNCGLLDNEMLINFLKNRSKNVEVIMTGRNPSAELLELADYISEINKVKHPYDKGICARAGIEK